MAGIVHEVENHRLVEQAEQEAAECARQLAEAAHLRRGQIVVVGCSTSEVVGHQVGSWSTPEVAQAIFRGLSGVFSPMGVHIAAQCCEHLNRSLVVEVATAERYNLEEVTVRPVAHAGGAMATAAYENFAEPVVVEKISAHLGIDIGQTLIGMHLKRVAVPVRLQYKKIGEAVLTAAKTRPPLVGGPRAQYLENRP